MLEKTDEERDAAIKRLAERISKAGKERNRIRDVIEGQALRRAAKGLNEAADALNPHPHPGFWAIAGLLMIPVLLYWQAYVAIAIWQLFSLPATILGLTVSIYLIGGVLVFLTILRGPALWSLPQPRAVERICVGLIHPLWLLGIAHLWHWLGWGLS